MSGPSVKHLPGAGFFGADVPGCRLLLGFVHGSKRLSYHLQRLHHEQIASSRSALSGGLLQLVCHPIAGIFLHPDQGKESCVRASNHLVLDYGGVGLDAVCLLVWNCVVRATTYRGNDLLTLLQACYRDCIHSLRNSGSVNMA